MHQTPRAPCPLNRHGRRHLPSLHKVQPSRNATGTHTYRDEKACLRAMLTAGPGRSRSASVVVDLIDGRPIRRTVLPYPTSSSYRSTQLQVSSQLLGRMFRP